ncbi:SDR family oxidoreductase [Mucilaginibacter ginsenosidivorans]|uniref:SDR family oxidoreductase n=1 Tax=Mucilaginibacter ginsenosidivorans TaxID=398053 RepID=A0A5B8UX48_9SPHI|nr:SDR family oxidoreductase [Mucilaginibacter ginsenosidivorans]QEC62966.1 SDR family oxidoreductase [Mucilaginibacter ginsenosidivorans]
MDKHELKNKAIVITGASSGAGRAAAVEFAKYGSAIVLAARNEEALHEVAAECTGLGAMVLVVVTDVTDPKAMINLANAANDWAGKIDVWINNAGVLAAGEFDHTPMEVHEQVIQTNLLGYIYGAHAVMPFFKARQQGTLINNISIGGYLPVPYGTGYTASKFGLRGFSEALRAELSVWPGIHICDLFPGFLDTPGIHHAGNYTGKALKPAQPVYDPKLLAETMVKVAVNPKSNRYVGGASAVLKLSHALFPGLTTKFAGYLMRRHFKSADRITPTSGNLFNTVDYGMSTNGMFGSDNGNKIPGKYIAGALVAGLAAGFFLMNLRK